MRGLISDALNPNVNASYVNDLLRAYKEGGVSWILRFVEEVITSYLRRIYEVIGIEFNDKICFSKLVDLGLIDEDTAVYLIATYMSIEEAVEEIEELEELKKKVKVAETIKEIASNLLEITYILNQLRSTIQ